MLSMRNSGPAIAALLLGCGAPATPSHASPEGYAPAETRCARDDECLVTTFDCSECGRCPGDPPWAALPGELTAAEDECRESPPVRNNPNAAALGLAVPACQPCDGGIPEFVTLYRAVCREGDCIAEPYATEPAPPPGELIDPNVPVVNP